jgi:hypothetical protein
VREDGELLITGEPERAAQRALEVLDHLHDDRVDHLLVEPRIRFGWVQAPLDQDRRLIEVDRRVIDVATGVVVHDPYETSVRTDVELLVDDVDHGEVADGATEAGVEGEDLEWPPRRGLDAGDAPFGGVGPVFGLLRLHRVSYGRLWCRIVPGLAAVLVPLATPPRST